MSEWSVIFSGTGTVIGPFNRGAPSTVVRFGDTQFLVDCGDGTLRQLARCNALRRLDAVLLTTPAAEQTIGLVALIEYLRRIPLGAPVKVFGPPGTAAQLDRLLALQPDLRAVVETNEPEPGSVFMSEHGIYIEAVPLERAASEPGFGYVFFEDPLPGRLDPVRAAQRGLKGPELARVQSGETVRGVRPRDVMGPPRPGRRLVVAGRCRPSPALEDAMTGADVGVIPAPYLDERLDVALASHTMTGWEAAELGREAQTKLVVLHQLAVQTPITAQRLEAREFYDSVFLPSDGDAVLIPVPDNAPPRVVPARKPNAPRNERDQPGRSRPGGASGRSKDRRR